MSAGICHNSCHDDNGLNLRTVSPNEMFSFVGVSEVIMSFHGNKIENRSLNSAHQCCGSSGRGKIIVICGREDVMVGNVE